MLAMTSYSQARRETARRDPSDGFRSPDATSGTAGVSRHVTDAHTYRLAIGLFGTWSNLCRALAGLSAEDLPAESLCLIGERLAKSVDGSDDAHQQLAAGLPTAYAGLFDHVREFDSIFSSANAYAAGNGLLLDDICCSLCAVEVSPADGKRGGYPQWLADSQCERISSHLVRGGIVLIVSSSSPTQQDASTRILLRYSQHGVQTHDFTVRPIGGDFGTEAVSLSG